MATSTSTENPDLVQLPREKWLGVDLYNWEGFWYHPSRLKAAMAARKHFQAHPDDIILASSTKTGTTWLNALIPSIVNASQKKDQTNINPLLTNHPNSLMPSLEIQIYKENPTPDLSGIPSPRLFRTHMSYQVLPESIKKSSCRIVYITRNPKDTVVSLWPFANSLTFVQDKPRSLNEVFESFCNGVHPFGPFFDHVLEYWKESLERPEKIMFLRYEDMHRDPKGEVKKLADFMGRTFAKDEEVDDVVQSCSFERISNLEVNKAGVEPWTGVPKSAYFRRGVVGDWKNHLTTDMAEKLDRMTRQKLDGTGFEFQA